MRMRLIGSGGGDLAGDDQAFAPVRARAALVRMAAVDNDRGTVEATLKKALIGVIADRRRHFALGVGNHAVGGNDHITFNTAHVCGPASEVHEIAE